MRILIINGNVKTHGFIAGALNLAQDHLIANGVRTSSLRLADAEIQDCLGCFNCLKTGVCILNDDTKEITERMLNADGFVIGAPVRNGSTTACYKRFYERITYRLGFPLLLADKHTLAISSVAYMGGKSINRKFLGLQDVFQTKLSDFLFFKVGLPTKLEPAQVEDQLVRSADRLMRNIQSGKQRPVFNRIATALERFMIRRFMLMKSPDQYAFVIKCWREKGYMK
jgi:multimeric flavodoxin WrbA